uniref:ZMYM2-like/QRICH1 C-terminal domain-containing protein n=1 Tax=Tetranychus urticae TaxID=32264 RepID=T1JSK9_TETUR
MSRFADPVSDSYISDFVESVKPQNTKRHEDWVKNLWFEWSCNREKLTDHEKPPSTVAELQIENCYDWVKKFIVEVRASDGKEYGPTSIKCIAAALYRLMKAKGFKGPSFLSRNSPVLPVVDAKLKTLKAKGVGLEVKRADVIEVADEVKLWSSGVLNMDTSQGLLNAVFFYNGKVLALRGRSEHYNLQIEQFNFKVDGEGKFYVEFWPLVRKTNQGTTKHSKIRSECLKQFDTQAKNSAISGKDGPKYGLQVVGINTIGSMLKKMFGEAGIVDDRVISNHGLRATAATTMFESGFSQRTISIRTGHISNAVNNYIRDNKITNQAVSACLEPVSSNVALESESLESESLQSESLQSESLQSESLQLESLQSESLEIEEIKNFNSPRKRSSDETDGPITIELSRGSKHLKITM